MAGIDRGRFQQTIDRQFRQRRSALAGACDAGTQQRAERKRVRLKSAVSREQARERLAFRRVAEIETVRVFGFVSTIGEIEIGARD